MIVRPLNVCVRAATIATHHRPGTIANAKNIGRSIGVQPDANVEVDLLGVCDAIAAARIEQLTVGAANRIIANIFDEQQGAFGDLLFNYKGRLVGKFESRV